MKLANDDIKTALRNMFRNRTWTCEEHEGRYKNQPNGTPRHENYDT